MNVFDFRDQLIKDYADYIKSFIEITDLRIKHLVETELEAGLLWPHPLIQLNPSFEMGESIEQLIEEEILHPECARIFRIKKNEGLGKPIQLYKHQAEAIKIAHGGHNYILTTGTGSGKSLAYIVPIVNHVLNNSSGKRIQAIIVYPMNALADSQFNELEKFIRTGYPDGKEPISPEILFRLYSLLYYVVMKFFSRAISSFNSWISSAICRIMAACCSIKADNWRTKGDFSSAGIGGGIK